MLSKKCRATSYPSLLESPVKVCKGSVYVMLALGQSLDCGFDRILDCRQIKCSFISIFHNRCMYIVYTYVYQLSYAMSICHFHSLVNCLVYMCIYIYGVDTIQCQPMLMTKTLHERMSHKFRTRLLVFPSQLIGVGVGDMGGISRFDS